MNTITPTQYNFSPLHIHTTYSQALLNYAHELRRNLTELIGFIFLSFVGLIWFTLLLLILYVGITQAALSALVIGVILLGITLGVLYLLVASARNSLQEKTRIQAFAQANNIELLVNKNNPDYNGMIFGVGDSRIILNAYIFKDENPLEVGNYYFKFGSENNSKMGTFGYIKIALPRRLPHFLLDSTYYNLYKNTGELPVAFDPSQKLQLEGDFNKHFTLYAPNQYEADIMYILTPDVMQALIDNCYKYDIEIIDNNLYIYSNTSFELSNEQEVTNIRHIAATISQQINHQADYYADSNIANRALDYVAPQGTRLKKTPNTLAILIVVVLLIIISAMFLQQTIPRIIAIVSIISGTYAYVYNKYIKTSNE